MAKGGKLRRIALLGAGLAVLNYGSALFERFLPYERKRRFQQKYGNPFGRSVMRWLPGWAAIETTGRRTGATRQVPVGGRLIGESFWLVAADPQEAAYVKNIEANARVRVQIGRQWRSGVAHLLPEDDARKRMFWLNPANALFIWIAGRDHLTIRVDLDPVPGRPAARQSRVASRTVGVSPHANHRGVEGRPYTP